MPKDLILYALFGGHFYWDSDIRGRIIVVVWQYSGQKLFFSGRNENFSEWKKNYSESISK